MVQGMCVCLQVCEVPICEHVSVYLCKGAAQNVVDVPVEEQSREENVQHGLGC